MFHLHGEVKKNVVDNANANAKNGITKIIIIKREGKKNQILNVKEVVIAR